jgi:hypothetical protein
VLTSSENGERHLHNMIRASCMLSLYASDAVRLRYMSRAWGGSLNVQRPDRTTSVSRHGEAISCACLDSGELADKPFKSGAGIGRADKDEVKPSAATERTCGYQSESPTLAL